MAKGLFITATGTDIGKTYVTALLVKKLREAGLSAGYYKAALSGAEWIDGRRVAGDAHFVKTISGLPDDEAELVSYVYDTAVSPHLAALLEGNPVELSKVVSDYQSVGKKHDYVTVEGSGGIVCPIRWDEKKLLLEDIILALKLPILIVGTASLGSINAMVLTVAYARQKGIPIKGILLNRYHPDDPMEVDNRAMIAQLTGVPILGTIGENDTELQIDTALLCSLYEENGV